MTFEVLGGICIITLSYTSSFHATSKSCIGRGCIVSLAVTLARLAAGMSSAERVLRPDTDETSTYY